MRTSPRSHTKYFAVLISLSITLSSCSSLMHSINPKGHAESLTKNAQWENEEIQTQSFRLWAAHPPFQDKDTVSIYLEGDGRVSSGYGLPSADPSSPEPLALKLALQQKEGNVAYLARPCQFMIDEDKLCESKYWTTARYHPKVIQATVEAIKYLKEKSHAKHIELIGHSGGGGLAILVAKEIPGLTKIVTLSGNLNLEEMESYHHSIPLDESLDPFKEAEAISNIPQVHYSGSKDTVVPPSIAQHYVEKVHSDVVKQIVVKGIDHWGWEKVGTWGK